MDEAGWKRMFFFSVAVLMSILLLWFGGKFLFTYGNALNSTQMFFAGMALVLGGIGVVTSQTLGNNLKIGFMLIVAGFYLFARAAGIIGLPWLAWIIGVACWAAAFLLLYITWPGRTRRRRPRINSQDAPGHENPES